VSLRETAKNVIFGFATLMVIPWLVSFALRAPVLGRDRALAGSSQSLALIPGVIGQYLRRAFFARVLQRCHRSVTIEFGTLFSRADAVLDEHVYIGPSCHLGLVHLETDVMLAAGVHVPSGRRTHGTTLLDAPMREQPGERTMVRIGQNCWIGSAAVVMADVGANSIVGAGAVVTSPIPSGVIAGGVPAKVLRRRDTNASGPRVQRVPAAFGQSAER
jgi:virginiamycin A acetyltransferase